MTTIKIASPCVGQDLYVLGIMPVDASRAAGVALAYERSAQRYTVFRGAVGDPDPFRVKYRQAITEQVAEIIRARCARREAVARLRRWAEDSVIEKDRKAFVAAAEETLASIHEGNFARYRKIN